VTTTTPKLPQTGSSLTGILWAGLALLLGGIAVLLFVSDVRSRRERPTDA
jgi:LPXTG-motif cell wall-anchored protein